MSESDIPAITQPQALQEEYPEVLAELQRLQEKKPGWSNAIWILAGSFVAFVVVGAANWNWKFTLWIIPVLLFHELGHWIAMRLFHYRNLRLFFIPFFGAAVTGQNWNVPGWKKALVSLAGPLPGIALGIVVGVAALVLQRPWMTYAALLLLFVNALNLLPILPLDGGHVLQATLFCRNRWLDGASRILAIVGLVGLGMMLGTKILPFLAIPMALTLPVMFKLGKVTDELRHEPLPEPSPNEDRVPAPTAQAIIRRIKDVLPGKITLSNKTLAQHTLMIFERLNAKPPGALATFSLLILQAGAFCAAVVVGILVIVGDEGGLRNFTAAAVRQPHHSWDLGDIEGAAGLQRQQTGDYGFVVTTLDNRAAAKAAFSELTKSLDPGCSITCLADSILVSLPASDEAARERWFDTLQARSTNTFVALSNAPINVHLTCIAPNKVAATNITRELSAYFAHPGIHLIAPWAPAAKSGDFAAKRKAREDWLALQQAVADSWRDPSVRAYGDRIQKAIMRGATTQADRLRDEQTEQRLRAEVRARERVRAAGPLDPALLDLNAKLSSVNLTNNAERSAIRRELAAKLGEVPFQHEQPASATDPYGATGGYVARHGLLIEIPSVAFYDLKTGFPVIADWLHGLGCKQIKYDLQGPAWFDQFDDLDQP